MFKIKCPSRSAITTHPAYNVSNGYGICEFHFSAGYIMFFILYIFGFILLDIIFASNKIPLEYLISLWFISYIIFSTISNRRKKLYMDKCCCQYSKEDFVTYLNKKYGGEQDVK